MNQSATIRPDEKLRSDLASLRIDRGAPVKRPRRRRGRTLIVVIALAVVAALAWSATHRAPTVSVAHAVVSTAAAGAEPVLSGSGYVVTGDRYVSIGVRVPGRIERYFVEEGQSVKQGDRLVQIDDRDYRAAVERSAAALEVARANQALADADLKRIRTLETQGVASRQELDVQENKVNVSRATILQLEAELAKAKVDLDYTVLRAPTDGVILAKTKEVGEIAVPGGFAGSGDLIRLANLNDMRAQVDVNEADLNRVRMGQRATVAPDAYPDAKYDAQVVKLYPQVDRQKGTLRIEVHILTPDDKLLPDMSARITFLSDPPQPGQEQKPTVWAPSNALRRDAAGNTMVLVVSDGTAHEQRVEAAGTSGDRVRIAGGLKGGEALIVGDVALKDGQHVVVKQ
ncbi:MAG TPA: efflux RND transporter periplasmic adaptor subunit [Candidatus Acidoferrales bacterium]|nr:efflux RND transporter periplasmic adaptor subunit [Candidatus Acidoferrales bacterium]